MSGRLICTGVTIGLDNGDESCNGGDVECTEWQGELFKEWPAFMKDQGGSQSGSETDETSGDTTAENSAVVLVFFFFGENLHCGCCIRGGCKLKVER